MLLTLLLLFAGVASPQEQHRTFRIPFHSVNGLILLDAKVNGVPAVLLFDTGASRTVVSVASSPVPQYHRNEAIHGQAVEVRIVLRLGEDFANSRVVAAMNLDTVEKQMGTRFDGILGQDVLREFSAVRIDYKNHVVELESAR